MLLYRDISSGDDLTARCVYRYLDELASGELSGLFLPVLAMLTTVVLEAKSSVVRDTLLVLVVLIRLMLRVGIKPGFYHKAQPSRFYGFYEGGFWGVYGLYVGFINLKVCHITPTTSCYLNTVFLCKQYWSKEKQPDQD